ncbi:MAG: D-alanyl-D-alanine carboxypeptidase/D-alanyl-D-alanine-endopeptidase [Elusimicrobia bacterium RIFOXYA2_FULL_40_6]|nr:MAG: D-alanyl-D-alanine carboxypeptidase/D-alanyl-D-alanine-endopeptidase [Elusimicrobia bacterium RIFOXYA2_FULL_40_6]
MKIPLKNTLLSAILLINTSLQLHSDTTAAFSQSIEKLLKNNSLYNGANVGIVIYNLDQNQPVYSKNENTLLRPASIMKVITTYCALKKLGSNFTFKTPVYLDKNLDNKNNTYNGNIYVQGMGDPSIMLENIDAFCQKLKAAGINKINGKIIYDVSNFDEENIRFFPLARNLYAPPAALCFNLNCIELKLIEKPSVKIIPSPETSYAKFDAKLKIENSNRSSIPEMTVTMKDDYDSFVIRGTVTNWTKAIKCLSVAVARPGLYFATVLKERLEKNYIDFNGAILKDKIDPTGLPMFYEIESKPLIEILKTMNRQSNNVIAENLGKYMGMSEFGAPGTREKGLRSITNVLVDSGIDKNAFYIADACGLSAESKITPDMMIKTLSTLYNNPEWQNLVIDSFDPKEYGGLQCFVKTGTLSSTGVNSLAGYIKSGSTGKYYAFCIIVNKASGSKAWSGTYTTPLILKMTELIKTNKL